MRRGFWILMFLLCGLGSAHALAQLVNPNVARWYALGNPGFWNGPVQYGAGGYTYYPENGQTAYSNAIRAQADLTLAQAQAAEYNAAAAEANERARQQYIENKARYDELRRQQRAAIEARNQQEREEMRLRAANRPAPKKPIELYPRLSADQLDPVTGEIHWPESLMLADYADDRSTIEEALKRQAENGPDVRTSVIINNAAKNMRTQISKQMNQMGFETYSATRKFLNSLALEGDHALEALK